eukprot:5410735-Pyramimonas_sp.AAC.1
MSSSRLRRHTAARRAVRDVECILAVIGTGGPWNSNRNICWYSGTVIVQCSTRCRVTVKEHAPIPPGGPPAGRSIGLRTPSRNRSPARPPRLSVHHPLVLSGSRSRRRNYPREENRILQWWSGLTRA